MVKGRPIAEFITYFHDAAHYFLTSYYNSTGQAVVSRNNTPTPLNGNAANFTEFKPSFGTNRTYASGVRSVSNKFTFIDDAAIILKDLDYNGRGYAEELYMRVFRYNPLDGIYLSLLLWKI